MSRGGDILQITANGSNLTGTEVNIRSATMRDGGMWFRPISGDKLRTPSHVPQVSLV